MSRVMWNIIMSSVVIIFYGYILYLAFTLLGFFFGIIISALELSFGISALIRYREGRERKRGLGY